MNHYSLPAVASKLNPFLMVSIPPRYTSPHQDSAGTASLQRHTAAGTAATAITDTGTQSHNAPTPHKRLMFTPYLDFRAPLRYQVERMARHGGRCTSLSTSQFNLL